MGEEFSPEQKRYLEGFASGVNVGRLANGLSPRRSEAASEPTGPDAAALKAMAATEAAGRKLVDQEKWKRAEHPFDAWPRLREQARAQKSPNPRDNFGWRYYGLFYVAPAQDSYMLRLRIPNGILSARQFEDCADIADRFGGGYSHVTTRANLQIREIKAGDAANVVEAVQDAGLTSRGSGADNIRNVTGSPTAGIDAQELLDTRPLAREWHHHILNDRSLYGLPRKFNVAFDGGGAIPVLEETNDIGFQAAQVTGEGGGFAPGLWCRLLLGGVTGHRDLARDAGVICRPDECTSLADAIIRVFIERGDRGDRAKARLKYVLDAMGFDAFLVEVEKKLGRPLARVEQSRIAPRPPFDKMAHIGVHPQRQAGLNWIGVALPVGKLTSGQMRGLAGIARDYGDRDIRLTVWQNLLVSGVADANVAAAQAAIQALGLGVSASPVRAGLVACTGAKGCKFAASDTKGHALMIADHVEAALSVDKPVNIHLTGCNHSCAQHYIGDIGLIGAKVPVNDYGDAVEGYDLVVGGGFAADARIARPLVAQVKAEDCPAMVGRLLAAWMRARETPQESFAAYSNRQDIGALQAIARGEAP